MINCYCRKTLNCHKTPLAIVCMQRAGVIRPFAWDAIMFDYHSKDWKRKREFILKRDGYQCQLAKQEGLRVEADTVHHIFPREDYPEYQWCEWNLISLNSSVHDSLHYRQNNELTQEGIDLLIRTARKYNIPIPGKYEMHKTLIIGLAGSGKTTYAKGIMLDESIVYDLDAIASAFRLKQPHEEYHKASRQMANDFLYGFIERISEYTNDAIIIRTAPSSSYRTSCIYPVWRL